LINNQLELISFFGFLFFIYFIFGLLIGFNFNLLPPPIHNVPQDAFMDWINVNIWANSSVKYSEWQSIYPPLTFAIANFLSNTECFSFQGISEELLQCARDSKNFFLGFFLLSMFLTYKFISKKINSKFSIKVGIIFFFYFSIPSIYLFERGNYLIIAYCLFLILLLKLNNRIYSILIKSILINLKPYFILFSSFYLFKRSFIEFFLVMLLSGLIFGISDLIVNDKNSLLFIKNSISFSFINQTLPFQGINYQMNFDLIFNALEIKFNLEYIRDLYLSIKIFSFLIFLYFLTKYDYSNYDFMFLSILLLMIISYSFGGYLCIFLLPFIIIYIKDKVILYMLILLMIPFDFNIYSKELGVYGSTVFSGGTFVNHSLNVSFFAGIRPLLVQILFFYFIYTRALSIARK